MDNYKVYEFKLRLAFSRLEWDEIETFCICSLRKQDVRKFAESLLYIRHISQVRYNESGSLQGFYIP